MGFAVPCTGEEDTASEDSTIVDDSCMVGTDVMSVRHVGETVVMVSNGVLTIVAHNNTSQTGCVSRLLRGGNQSIARPRQFETLSQYHSAAESLWSIGVKFV